MKTGSMIALGAILVCSMVDFSADAAEKAIPGPKGGRLLDSKPARAEFFVNAERKVEITFYDENLKAALLGEQVVSAIAEAKSGKVKLEFEKKEGSLVSITPLPEGQAYIVVVQIRTKAGDKPQNFRVGYHEGICSDCKRAEYACVCESHGEKEHGHGH